MGIRRIFHFFSNSKETCKYQRILTNGQIEFDSTQVISNHSDSIELVENSRIKFECSTGYHLKVTKANSWSTFLDKNYVIEKCNRLANVPNTNKKLKPTRSKSSNFYECIKSCKLNRHSAKLNGILVPFRKLYVPNDRITLLCNEGHVANLQYFNQTTIKTNNLFSFECQANGAWYLFPEKIQIDQLPSCESLNIPSEIFDGRKDIEFNLNYENLRTISVMFFVCILLLTLFILIVFTIKLRKKLFNNIEQQLSHSDDMVNEDGFIRILNTTGNTGTSNETTRRSIYPTAANRLINFDSQLTLGAYSRIIDATLPTYEEATNSRSSNMVTSANLANSNSVPNALNTQNSDNNK